MWYKQTLPFFRSCDSFILTAPFRAKSIQLEIRTVSGSLEHLVKKIRQNVLQVPTRQSKLDYEETKEPDRTIKQRSSTRFQFKRRMNKSSKGNSILENIQMLYSDKADRFVETERKIVRHTNKNFVLENIKGIVNTKRVQYDSDEDEYFFHKKIAITNPIRHRRRKTSPQPCIEKKSIADRPNIQPVDLSVVVLMSDKSEDDDDMDDDDSLRNTPRESIDRIQSDFVRKQESPEVSRASSRIDRRRSSISDKSNIRFHLKQTTCPACMEKYKIPLPTPKTPKVKPSSLLPMILGENPVLRVNSKNRISMLINKETFKLESYERRFASADDRTRRKNLNKKELDCVSNEEFTLSPLEMAKIEQEIKEKETQKKLEQFLTS